MSKRTRIRVGFLGDVFPSGSTDELLFHARAARLAVLYEDLRIELHGIVEDDIWALDELDGSYRRFYFARRSIATLEEFSQALWSMNECPSFVRLKSRCSTDQASTDWEPWDSAITFFQQNRDFIRKVRNDIGGHFGLEAAKYSVENLEPTATGKIEVVSGRQGKGENVKLHFAGEIAVLATLRRLEGADAKESLSKFFHMTKKGHMHAMKAVQTLVSHYMFDRFGR